MAAIFQQQQVLWFYDRGDRLQGTDRTDWVLVTNNAAFLSHADVRAGVTAWIDTVPKPITWTDDYSNLVGVLFERK